MRLHKTSQASGYALGFVQRTEMEELVTFFDF